MTGPDVRWLTVTNILLGAFVVLCVVVIAVGWLCELVSRLRRRISYDAELNHDMEEMFGMTHPRRSAIGFLHTKAEPCRPESQPGFLDHLCSCVKRARAALWRWCSSAFPGRSR